MSNDLRDIISSEFGLPTDLDPDAPIFTSGLLDSLSAVRLLAVINERFGITLSPLDVGLDDVDTLNAIDATVQRLG